MGVKKYNYKIIGDKVIAYKGCRGDGYSLHNFGYKYEVGKEYEAKADYNPIYDNSYGLAAWHFEGAKSYCLDRKVFKIEIDLEDLAMVTDYLGKIRA